MIKLSALIKEEYHYYPDKRMSEYNVNYYYDSVDIAVSFAMGTVSISVTERPKLQYCSIEVSEVDSIDEKDIEKYVAFEDDSFKALCVKFLDKNHDGEVSLNEAKAAKSIRIATNGISSLKGIEDFANLTLLDCTLLTYSRYYDNGIVRFYDEDGHEIQGLKYLDVSKNAKLKYLYCSHNHLTVLNLSKNSALEAVNCEWNKLTSLDIGKNEALTQINCAQNQLAELNTDNNPKLERIECQHNRITSLDVSQNALLTHLDCTANRLTELDLDNNIWLEDISCNFNKLSNLDVTHNACLHRLWCSSNRLKSLNLNINTKLTSIGCGANLISELDVSNCPDLYELYCFDNKIHSLDLSKNLKLRHLSCIKNNNREIHVWPGFKEDNVTFLKDESTVYVER